ncbi:MAG: transglutaminase-like domain-containing protein [Spirochaetaceae bacterium]|jgi:transglutaminase-like putative cysteine protease|nr:transglutaminase-like domain-containing protein [Spirochaetaceae bacterium]
MRYFFLFTAFLLTAVTFLYPQNLRSRNSDFVIFTETFDTGSGFDKNKLWQGNVEITDAQAEINKNDLKYFENDTKFIKLNAAQKGTSVLTLSEITVPLDSVISFRYKTEIIGRAGQTFKVYLDDKQAASFEGVDGSWLKATIPLPAGSHSVRFEAQNVRGATVTNGYNAVYLDDVIIVQDSGVELLLFPRGRQDTFVGAAGLHRIRFTTKTLRADDSERDDNKKVVFSASGGTIDSNGFWTPPGEGTFTVSAVLGDLKAVSSLITVHPADYLKKAFTYAGTGKTYHGYIDKKDSALKAETRESLKITSPEYAAFEADGFFLLEGTVNKPRSQNHARVVVTKQNTKLETWYIIKNNFSQRIWLPFGAGEYTIKIYPFDSATITRPPKGDGALTGGSYSEEPVVLTVLNRRDEKFVDGDARWIYPSFYVQSDDFVVTNLLNNITFGETSGFEKTRAIHDYIVSKLSYDSASFSNRSRSRKMDAVSVIENSVAVCEGYANLSAALLRAAGIPVKVVAANSIRHAWNNVYIDGAWKFYDATWDDPVPDRGPGVVDYKYFMLDSLSGGDNRHRGAGAALIGDAG